MEWRRDRGCRRSRQHAGGAEGLQDGPLLPSPLLPASCIEGYEEGDEEEGDKGDGGEGVEVLELLLPRPRLLAKVVEAATLRLNKVIAGVA